MRQIACPIALHPDGGRLRVAVATHPERGQHLVHADITEHLAPAATAARALWDQSGLETRAALPIGQSDEIATQARWHFVLCRVVPPVRAQWLHPSPEEPGAALRFSWCALDGAEAAASASEPVQRALAWMRNALEP